MKYLNIEFVSWKELIQKPSGNVLTDTPAITISINFDDRLHDQ
jgi:hypothetical protein